MIDTITTTPEPKSVEIVVIADRSGSMGSIRNDAIGGFNTFIGEQQKQGGEANLTVALFDDKYEIMQDKIPLGEAVLFDEKNFIPRGMTALFDAIGKTLNTLIERREKGEIDGAIVTILTDGAENASREYRVEQIKTLIEKCEKDYGWEFIFLAANQDAFATGSTFGISAGNAYNFSADAAGLKGATMAMNLRSTEYRTMYAQAGLDKLAQKDSDSEESN
jgi:hypothetical protein